MAERKNTFREGQPDDTLAARFSWVSYYNERGLLQQLLAYNDVPWSTVCHRMSLWRVALVTTAGVHLRSDTPFEVRRESTGGPPVPSHLAARGVLEAGDWSCRVIPGNTPADLLTVTHEHYRTADALADPNCVFPIDRLRELAAHGVIDSVAPRHFGLMGFIPDPEPLIQDTAQEIARQLLADGVTTAVMSPG